MKVYLDNNATTPVDEKVLEAMLPYFRTKYGNAASAGHIFGWEAKEAVDIAREKIAAAFNCEPVEIIFTSGATESINLAIKGVYERFEGYGNHIITVKTEHSAVLDTCKYLESKGASVTYLDVDKNGLLDLDELESEITDQTILIAVMYVNNETGVLQPVEEISAIARKHNILFISDAAQAAGKIKIDVQKAGIDLMPFSAHKLYGPKGVGGLFVRRKKPRVQLIQQLHGGGHEKGLRSGTLNVPGIVGMGKAIEISVAEMKKNQEHIKTLRNHLESYLFSNGIAELNGSSNKRIYNVSNVAFRGRNAGEIISKINKKIAVSTGSACTSAEMQPSHVLLAMGKTKEIALASIRFSFGKYNTTDEISMVINAFRHIL